MRFMSVGMFLVPWKHVKIRSCLLVSFLIIVLCLYSVTAILAGLYVAITSGVVMNVVKSAINTIIANI